MNAEDRQAIIDLISQYSQAYDANDMERFVALFDTDGVIESPLGKWVSNEQIRQEVATRRQELTDQGIQPRHYQTNTLLTEIEEGRIEGRTMVFITWQYVGEQEPKVKYTSIYEDEFRKTDKG